MQLSIASPVQASPWSTAIPCVTTKNDQTTGTTVHRGFCLTSAEKKIACWRTDKGWFEENFVEGPANRIKGWLEMTEYLLKQAATTGIEDVCDRIMAFRAASDGLAVIDKITKDEKVSWDQPLNDLYQAIRNKVSELSKKLETDTRDATGSLVVKKILQDETPLIQGLSDSVKLASTAMKRDNGNKVEVLAGVSIAALASVVVAIGKGVVAFFATKLGVIILAVVAIAVAIYIVVRIFDEAWKTIKSWFGG